MHICNYKFFHIYCIHHNKFQNPFLSARITLMGKEVGRDVGNVGSFSIPFICRILSSKELCLDTCSVGWLRVVIVGPL